MKRTLATLVATAALAACAEAPTSPAASLGVSSPNTAVSAEFVVYVEGTITYRDSGPSNNGNGFCTEGGRYNTKSGNATQWRVSDPQHPQCASITAGSTVTVTFSDVANYVKATNGNVNLNFTPDPTDGVTPRNVQYKKNGDWTTGTGVLYGAGDDGSAWTIDLAQISASSNLLSEPPRQLIVNACSGSYPSCYPATLSW